MQPPSNPPDERGRLKALHAYGVLDTPPDPVFDTLTQLAAHILDVPIALVSLVDADRQWFKSRYGLDVPETPRGVSFCGHVVETGAPLLVPDALEDPRFVDNQLVIDVPRVRFYFGVPLRTAEGHVLGTLCVIDREPRELSPRQRALLELLAAQTMTALELHRQNRALRELRAQNESLRRFFELSPDLLATADRELQFQLLSPAWEATVGWTREELQARHPLDFVHADDLELAVRETGRVMQNPGQIARFECRFLCQDGSWVPLAWVVVASEGTFYGAARNVADHHRLISELTEGELRLRSIIDTAADAILAVDGDGRIERANPATERLFGYGPAELEGHHLRLLMPGADLAWLEQPGFAGPERSTVGQEVIGRGKDGTSFPVELAPSAFQVDGGRRFTVVLRDVTERAQADQLKRELISTVSHELRTPLTSIRGSLGLVAAGVTGELPAMAAEYVGIALSGCERLVRLVNDMLDLDKMAAGRLELHMGVVDIAEACRRAIATTEAQAGTLGVAVRLLAGPTPHEVWADEDRVAQVLGNLLSNAIKFSPSDAEVRVAIAASEGRVRVSVVDRGPGIAEGFRARIFQRFAQADGSDARASGGSGLGLAISKAIVEAMGGQIGFSDAEGGGTVFYFELEKVSKGPALR